MKTISTILQLAVFGVVLAVIYLVIFIGTPFLAVWHWFNGESKQTCQSCEYERSNGLKPMSTHNTMSCFFPWSAVFIIATDEKT